VNIQTVQFAHILEKRDLETLHSFLAQTAFVISHKNESIATLLRVLWYIPVNSTIIVVTNCPQHEQGELTHALRSQLAHHHKTFLIHQKDDRIAHLFQQLGVPSILGTDGRVRSGKGEGMYIGALCAYQLGYPRWLIFYDADNLVPSALLEYTLALGRLFLSPPHAGPGHAPDLHNVRICWASKPPAQSANWQARILGRTTKVVSPLFESLLEGWFGIFNHQIRSSNAGEQAMTVRTASELRFSAGFSIETFQLLDLLWCASCWRDPPREIVFQQYLSQSPHFHEKKGNEHIKKMIEESLGSFTHFAEILPEKVHWQLQKVYADLQLALLRPAVYPRLRELPLTSCTACMRDHALFPARESQGPVAPEGVFPGLLTGGAQYQDLLLPDTALPEIVRTDPESPHVLVADPPCQHLPYSE
jgi:mannosyl-3-phosphoglycerate synthase